MFSVKTVCAREYVQNLIPKVQYKFISGTDNVLTKNPIYAIKFGPLVMVTFSFACHTTNTWGGLMNTITVPWKAKYSVVTAVDGQGEVVRTASIDTGSNIINIQEFSYTWKDCWVRGQLIYFTDD